MSLLGIGPTKSELASTARDVDRHSEQGRMDQGEDSPGWVGTACLCNGQGMALP